MLSEDIASRLETEQEWISLVQSIAEGNQAALRLLYDQTHRLVLTLTFRVLNNRETAEEVTMDVFLQVWSRASSYDTDRGSVIGWITNLARSRAIDRLRFSQRTKRRSSDLGGLFNETTVSYDAEDSLDSAERKLLLEQGLECLSPDERRVIEAAYLFELTHQEVARKLGIPLGTVKTRIRIALNKLKTAIAPQLKSA